MKGDRLRLGFIGCGAIAAAHVNNLRSLPETQMIAFSDPVKERAEQLAQFAGVDGTVFTDWREMIRIVPLDGVLILSPHAFHAEQVLACLESGLAVLVEKPMCVRLSEARDIVGKKEETNGIILVSYQRRYMAPFRFARKLVSWGGIGEVELSYAVLGHGWKEATKNTWRQVPEISGGGMLMDSGSHSVDIVLWLLSRRPQRVWGSLRYEGTPVEINDILTLQMDGGSLVSLIALGDIPVYREFYEFIGTDGTVKIDLTTSPPLFVADRGGSVRAVRAEEMGESTTPDRNFVDVILGRAPNESPPEDSVWVLAVTEAFYRSAISGRSERVAIDGS